MSRSTTTKVNPCFFFQYPDGAVGFACTTVQIQFILGISDNAEGVAASSDPFILSEKLLIARSQGSRVRCLAEMQIRLGEVSA